MSPLPPGPPGLTSSGPWYFFAVCGTRDRASVIFLPRGSAWFSGTFREAHWRVGYALVAHFFQESFATGAAAEPPLASAGTAVTIPASTAAAPHRAVARFFICQVSQDGGCRAVHTTAFGRIVPE